MAAKMVAVKSLTPGCILADTVLSLAGKTLLGEGLELTPRQISLLMTWDIQNVFIQAQEEEEQPPDEPVGDPVSETNRKANSEAYMRFVQEYDSIVTTIAQTFDFIQKRNIVSIAHFKETAGTIHSSIASNGLAALNYLLISDYKLADFVSRHSVMVAFFSGIIARQMKWSEDDIRGVAMAGLLHDLGNLTAGKRDGLEVRAYIAESAALLKEIKGIPNEVILGILQHRECIDGSGFPTGVNGSKVHPYAKIIAVADTFHAQAYTNEYANPFAVLDTLSHEMFGKLDTAVCHTFISQVRDSMLNNKIVLSDGRQAEVIFFHPNGSCFPVVRMEDGQIADLSQPGELTVSRLVTPD
ncbi:MAG: HD domain-containing protein [Negativicutes bacterium]|nr:HD domain-containing protein [Negativicutes bacterium]